MASSKIAIIGAGIIGITNAILLLEKGLSVTVFTKDSPFNTNSDAAVAAWYCPDDSKPLLQKYCLESLPKLYELGKTPGTGISIIPAAYYFKDEAELQKSVWIKGSLHEFLTISFDKPLQHIQEQGYAVAVLTHIPLMDVNIYRAYLFEQFKKLGGELIIKAISSLPDLLNDFDIVINCAGWEAKFLTQDDEAYPVRGQIEIATIEPQQIHTPSLNFPATNAYVIFRPLSKQCVLGTTYEKDNYHHEPSVTDKETILSKISLLYPEALNFKTQSKAGIRSGRHDVRVEAEYHNNKLILHCYGHGGSGYGASWATAYQVLYYCYLIQNQQSL